jgi:hypothetical protein
MNINHPGQASNPKARRLVRSHITRRQHNQKRSASVQALGSEPARTRTNGRGDDASKSQYDGLSPSPSTRTICPSARTSSYKAAQPLPNILQHVNPVHLEESWDICRNLTTRHAHFPATVLKIRGRFVIHTWETLLSYSYTTSSVYRYRQGRRAWRNALRC